MNSALIGEIIGYLTVLLILLTAYFSVKILLRIGLIENKGLKIFFKLLSLGIILFSAAEILFIVFNDMFPSPADVFYVGGTVFFMASFLGLYAYSNKSALSGKDKSVFTSVLIITVLLIFYLFYTTLLPLMHSLSYIEIGLNIFYPITSASIFLMAYVYREHSLAKGGYALYISAAFFLIFVGDMMFTYTSWKEIHGALEIINALIYLLAYSQLLFGVYLFYKTEISWQN